MQPTNGHISLCGLTPVPDRLSSSSSNDASGLSNGRINGSTCGLLVPPGIEACKSVTGIVAPQGAYSGLESEATTFSGSGLSRICGKDRALAGPSCPPPDITCPDIPQSCSDTETIYSVQDYETGMSYLYVDYMEKHSWGSLASCRMVHKFVLVN